MWPQMQVWEILLSKRNYNWLNKLTFHDVDQSERMSKTGSAHGVNALSKLLTTLLHYATRNHMTKLC